MRSRVLANAEVFRGGATDSTLRSETKHVTISGYEKFDTIDYGSDGSVWLTFSLAASGKGVTNVRVVIKHEDFESIFDVLTHTDRQAAMLAMSRVLLREFEAEPKHNEVMKKKARAEIVHVAYRKWQQSNYAEKEQSFFTDVKELIEMLDAAGTD